MDTDLVAGRECGACRACCIEFAIDDPDLQKLPGFPCHNLLENGGCGIYASRPLTCRTFYCGWRRFKWIGAEMRPDTSRVLIMEVKEPCPTPGSTPFAIAFVLIDRSALEANGLAEAVAATVQAGIGAHLLVPGRPGEVFRRQRLNERLADPVRRKDKPSVLRILRNLRRKAALEPTRPLILTPPDAPRAKPDGASEV